MFPTFAVLRVNGGLDEVKSLLHDRWEIGDAPSREDYQGFWKAPSRSSIRAHLRQRYGSLVAQAQTVATHACRRPETYEQFRGLMSDFIDTILSPVRESDGANSDVVDLGGVRPAGPACKSSNTCDHGEQDESFHGHKLKSYTVRIYDMTMKTLPYCGNVLGAQGIHVLARLHYQRVACADRTIDMGAT
jgi:hypothetical protein